MERQRRQAWGRTTHNKGEGDKALEVAPRDKADSWLRAVTEGNDKVKNMIL
jgi:hypothetical protein